MEMVMKNAEIRRAEVLKWKFRFSAFRFAPPSPQFQLFSFSAFQLADAVQSSDQRVFRHR
jgi:hypothetical protein